MSIVPTFAANLHEKYAVNEGELLELVVSYGGQPEPHIRWLKDAIEIMENANFSVIFAPDGQQCKLIIRKIQCEDSGTYSCVLENEAGNKSCKTLVNVRSATPLKISSTGDVFQIPSDGAAAKRSKRAAPEIISALTDETVCCGQKFVLTCKISTTAKGKLSWFRNNEKIEYVCNQL